MKSIGMDVHSRQTYFCVLNERGSRIDSGRVETTEKGLQAVVERHGVVQIAIEASTTAWWVQDILKKAGAEVEVTNPYKLKLIAESRSKTDKADAQILAELLRCGGLPTPVYVPSADIMELRQKISLRRQLIKIRTQIICSAKARLRGFGIKLSPQVFHTMMSWSKTIEGHKEHQWYLEPLREVFKKVEGGINGLVKDISEKWDKDPSVHRLWTICGIGPIVAYTIIAALADAKRFATSKQVNAYAGLVPIERSTGESVHRGGITHEGRVELREALVQAAWAVLRTRKDNAIFLKKFYYKIMYKRGSQIAITALARKLLTIAYHVLRDEMEFDGTKVQEKKRIEKKITRSPSVVELDPETVAWGSC
jgi:transposase